MHNWNAGKWAGILMLGCGMAYGAEGTTSSTPMVAATAAPPAKTAAAATVPAETAAPAPAVPRDRVIRLGEVLVEATALKRDLLETPTVESSSLTIASSTVETEDISKQNATTLAETMEYTPGVLTETRGRKEKTLTSFRGQIYPYPDFALNGVWQRAFWELPSFFPAVAIDRVEILRSGGAIMVGPNSGLVGAVNIVPRRFDEPTTIVDAQAGTYNTNRESIVHGNRLEHGYYTVGGSNYSTSGPDNANAAERSSSVFGTVGYDPAENLHLELTSFYMQGARELRLSQDPGEVKLRSQYEQYDPYSAVGSIARALIKHDDTASTEFDLGFVKRDASWLKAAPPAYTHEDDDQEFNAGVIHAHNLSDSNTLRVGVQYNHWICPNGKRDFMSKRMDVETGSVVLMDEQRFDRLTLDAGVRLTRSWYRDYYDNSFNITGDPMSGRAIQDAWGDPVAIETMGAKYQLTKPLALYAHLATGSIDAPPGAAGKGGTDLSSEQRLMLDGGVSLEDKRYGSAKFGGFATLRQDAILLDNTKITDSGEKFNTYTNNDVRQYGLELECRSAKLFKHLTLFGTATVMTAERSLNDEWTRYDEIPSSIYTVGTYTELNQFDVNIFGKYVSHFENKRFAQDGLYHDLGDYTSINMNAGYSFGKNKSTRIYCTLQNLLDSEYSTVVGYPDYGFQAFLGIQHRM